MDKTEWFALLVIASSLIGVSVIADQGNQTRIDKIYYGLNTSITTLYNDSIGNLTNLATTFQNSLASKDGEITDLNSQVTILTTEKSSLQSQLLLLQANITFQVELQIQLIRNQLINVSEQLNETLDKLLNDPTEAQLISFLSTDLTDSHPYNNVTYGPDYYVCTHFSRDLIHNATSNHWRSMSVHMDLYNETSAEIKWHSIVVFNTTDHGLAFVEPQTDEIFYNLTYLGTYAPFNHTIKDIVIMW